MTTSRLVAAPGRAAATTVATGAVLALGLVVSVIVATSLGAAHLAPGQVWADVLSHLGLGGERLGRLDDAIVWDLRMPRVLTAGAVGAGLSLCGAVLQALLRNPLADPYLLGISSGASLGAVSVLLLGLSIALPAAAFGGGLLALVLVLVVARAGDSHLDPGRTILAGVAASACFGALTSLVIFWSVSGDSYHEILAWLLGSVAGSTWQSVAVTVGAVAVIGAPIAAAGRILDAFTFGETAAAALGVPVTRTRWLLLGATALLTSALVAYSGSIGFVGLVLPHAVRMLTGPNNRRVLPLSALLGAIFLIWADTAARTVVAPRELPVGVVTAIIGAPAFAVLLMRKRA